MTNTPFHELPTWQHQILANGYLAAMNGEPINPVAPDLWLQGYALFLEQNVSAPIRRQFPASTSVTSAMGTRPPT